MSEPADACFSPGPDWREVDPNTHYTGARLVLDDPDAARTRVWVRADPVPDLPTEPYTVIRVTWKDEAEAAELLTFDGRVWRGGGWAHGPGSLALDILDFEVLAEPKRTLSVAETAVEYPLSVEQVQADTARAVLDRVRRLHHSAGDLSIPGRFRDELDHIAHEFGVEAGS